MGVKSPSTFGSKEAAMEEMQSMSVSRGDPASRSHNVLSEYREGLEHVDAERTRFNEVLLDRFIEDVYEDAFGGAVREYNAEQVAKGRPGRQISDYLAKIKASKQEKFAYELVIQIGNRDTNPASDEECRRISAEILRAVFERIRDEFPQFEIVNASIHMDEATPHLHIQYVPVAIGGKRGLSKKNSHSQAMKQMGYHDSGEVNERLFAILQEEAAKRGIQRIDLDTHRKHEDVRTFKAMASAIRAGEYPYENDPAFIVALGSEVEVAGETANVLLEAKDALEDAQKMVAEFADQAERLPPDQIRAEAMELSRQLGERAGYVGGVRRAVAGWAKEVVAAIRAIPLDWRKYIVNPVMPWLKEAREKVKDGMAALWESVRHASREGEEEREDLLREVGATWLDMAKNFGKPVYPSYREAFRNVVLQYYRAYEIAPDAGRIAHIIAEAGIWDATEEDMRRSLEVDFNSVLRFPLAEERPDPGAVRSAAQDESRASAMGQNVQRPHLGR